MFACNGILFNHESPLRGETFVTRKITRALSRIHLGLQGCLYLGNLDAHRDWGHARDFVEAQWLMLQQDRAEDFVISTGIQHSVRDFVNEAALTLGMTIDWQGSGASEQGIVRSADESSAAHSGQRIVAIDPRYFRPAEVDTLLGDSTKARDKLGWRPTIHFPQLVREMMETDLDLARRDVIINSAGFRSSKHHD
jgi:GDPmannose 4,6-dehydratase